MSDTQTDRIVSYVSKKVGKWARERAAELGFTESSYVRFLIMKEMRETKGK